MATLVDNSLNDEGISIDWKSSSSLLKHFPLIPGKGKLTVPYRLLQNAHLYCERKDLVLRWRSLSEDEQRRMKEELGYKIRSSKNSTHQTALSSAQTILEIGNLSEVPGRAENEPREVANQEAEGSFTFVGLLDNSGIRVTKAEEMISNNKRIPKRRVGSQPESRAQVKDRTATKERVKLISKLYDYISMTTLPNFDRSFYQSTSDIPCLRTAIIILDGFKPNNPNGGRWKSGTERRDKPLLNICTGSENDWLEILKALRSMDNCSNSFGSYLPKFDIFFAYTFEDAIAEEVSEAGHDYYNTDSIVESPVSVTCFPNDTIVDVLVPSSAENIDWKNQEWINQKFQFYKGRGTRPVPHQWIEKYSTLAGRERQIREWRRLIDKQQRIYEADYLSCETNLDALNNVQQENIMQKWDSSELSLTVQSSYDFSKNDSNDGVDISFKGKTKKYRALGSPPNSLAQVKDKYSRKARADLLSHLFSYIQMTTPPERD